MDPLRPKLSLISMIPALSSTLLPKVDTPATTSNPPEIILTPFLAVTNPIESTLVTSSYVRVPPTDTLPITRSS
jgi:hypothetical protein